jgi:isoleucyl-tRNA synthetase
MEKFKSLEKKNPGLVEAEITKRWDEMDLLNLSIDLRKKHKPFVFYDGPATANGMPGAHHMLAKILKDAIGKYETMQGKMVLRKVGWDTHGLPVEVQVEKELGFNGKADIEKYGIEKFNKKCRESVWQNEEAFTKFTKELGQLIDLKNPYITYDNNYIETEWWILKKLFDEGYIYEGLKVTPYCPRCGTSLASHEVAQGYKTISVNTVYVPFKVKNEANTYLLIWTTTPWTLIANVGVCVNPKLTYLKIKSQDNYFIVAETLVNNLFSDYEVVSKCLGKDLEYLEYEQFLPFLSVNKKGFFVCCDDYVTADDGTGLVHLAPAYGADDNRVGQKYNLPVLNPVGPDGKYTEGPWTGHFVMEDGLDIEIIKYLISEGKLFKKQKMEHDYPHCWRCDTPLLYYSKPSLYIKTTAKKNEIIAANKKVHWFPAYVGEKRFGNWLDNMVDWGISRNRYWGTPIPLWKCSCGYTQMVGSRKELKDLAIENINDDIELHRPYVDNVHLKCPKCGKVMTRIKDVMDCWFDSGSMPFAQYHYPFENQKLFENQFPADFICEGIDQTRGWFYSLLVISVFVKGISPYKNVLVNDLVLDKDGIKMHKSRGNAISPFPVLEEYGSDATRWFMLSASPVWTPLRFDLDGIKDVSAKFFGTLKNTYTFFEMYANADGIDPRKYHLTYNELEEIDKWLLSKYHNLIKNVTNAFKEYDLTKATHYITNFVCEDLSNWYIRRNRRRFWKSDADLSKKGVYQTTYEVLCGVCQLMAPIASFTAEEIYTNLTGEKSVLLTNYPKYNKDLVNVHIEERMDQVRALISLGHNAREDAKIKVRQPINDVLIDGKNKVLIDDLLPLIKEELNVKVVNYTSDVADYMDFLVKPNFKLCGAMFGKNIKAYQELLQTLPEDKQLRLYNGDEIKTKFLNNELLITPDMVDIKIMAKPGFDVAMDSTNFIILDTNLTEDLILEGIARELVSKVQNLRKTKDFDIQDRITLYYHGDETIDKVITNYDKFIKNETLATKIIKKESGDKYDLNGHDTNLDVTKI